MSGSTSSGAAGGSSCPTDRRVVLHVTRVVHDGHLVRVVASMTCLGTCKRWNARAHACTSIGRDVGVAGLGCPTRWDGARTLRSTT
jgi:hypothetical protein